MFFCKNAQEEALKGIERQMAIANELKALRELLDHDAITEEEYIEHIRRMFKVSHDAR